MLIGVRVCEYSHPTKWMIHVCLIPNSQLQTNPLLLSRSQLEWLGQRDSFSTVFALIVCHLVVAIIHISNLPPAAPLPSQWLPGMPTPRFDRSIRRCRPECFLFITITDHKNVPSPVFDGLFRARLFGDPPIIVPLAPQFEEDRWSGPDVRSDRGPLFSSVEKKNSFNHRVRSLSGRAGALPERRFRTSG